MTELKGPDCKPIRIEFSCTSVFLQTATALAANSSFFAIGHIVATPGCILPQVMDDMNLSVDDGSWFGILYSICLVKFILCNFPLFLENKIAASVMLLGALVGSFGGGLVSETFGRKICMLFDHLVLFAGIVAMAKSGGFLTLLIGRILSGYAFGSLSVVIPVYTCEMAQPQVRKHSWHVLHGFVYLRICLSVCVGCCCSLESFA